MANELDEVNSGNENNGQKKGNSNKSDINGFENSVILRLPEVLLLLSGDNINGDRKYPGTVGFKYGPSKDDWIRIPYITMKKIIDFCLENKVLFNDQLRKEREKNLVSDL